MPLFNEFYGVYKIGKILTGVNGHTTPDPYIVKSITPSQKMGADAAFYLQGDPRTKVLNISHTSESFSVVSPILVPHYSNTQENLKDGRVLLRDKANNAYIDRFPKNMLPILTGATITIGTDESNINLQMLSDGNPNNSINVYEIAGGTSALIEAIGLNYAARIAKNWDFAVQLGELMFYIQEATINLQIKHSEHNFLGVAANNYWASYYNSVPYDGTHNGIWNPNTFAEHASYSGWQFPFIAIGGITIDVSGTAALVIDPDNPANNVNYNRNSTVVYNRPSLIAAANVTLQHPGELTFTQDNFNVIQIYKDGSTIPVIPEVFSVNSAIVKQHDANFTDGIMTVKFQVQAFVGTD